MDQLKNLVDDRLINGCIYCGGPGETRDHVPSRVFLDLPFPPNLPVLPACFMCNNGFSRDEEYVACLIESAIAGSADPDRIRRPRIASLYRRRPSLRARIEKAINSNSGQIDLEIEDDRVRNVILKLARGHVAYELGLPCREEPKFLEWRPLVSMNDEEMRDFEAVHVTDMLGEVGSRGMQRMRVTQLMLTTVNGTSSSIGFLINEWVDVQEDRYEYLAFHEGDKAIVKIIIGGYLATEVRWEV